MGNYEQRYFFPRRNLRRVEVAIKTRMIVSADVTFLESTWTGVERKRNVPSARISLTEVVKVRGAMNKGLKASRLNSSNDRARSDAISYR